MPRMRWHPTREMRLVFCLAWMLTRNDRNCSSVMLQPFLVSSRWKCIAVQREEGVSRKTSRWQDWEAEEKFTRAWRSRWGRMEFRRMSRERMDSFRRRSSIANTTSHKYNIANFYSSGP